MKVFLPNSTREMGKWRGRVWMACIWLKMGDPGECGVFVCIFVSLMWFQCSYRSVSSDTWYLLGLSWERKREPSLMNLHWWRRKTCCVSCPLKHMVTPNMCCCPSLFCYLILICGFFEGFCFVLFWLGFLFIWGFFVEYFERGEVNMFNVLLC